MAQVWIQVTIAAAIGVILVLIARLDRTLTNFAGRLDRLEAPPPQPPDTAPPGQQLGARRPMLGAIMDEGKSPLSVLARWPAGPPGLAASGLALLAIVMALAARPRRLDPATGARLTALQQKLDSVSIVVTQLRDSITGNLAAQPAPPPTAAPAALARNPERTTTSAAGRTPTPGVTKARAVGRPASETKFAPAPTFSSGRAHPDSAR